MSLFKKKLENLKWLLFFIVLTVLFVAQATAIAQTHLIVEAQNYYLISEDAYFYANWKRSDNYIAIPPNLAENWIANTCNKCLLGPLSVATGDINHDGLPEIVVATANGEVIAYDSNGRELSRNPNVESMMTIPDDIEIADFNSDSQMEIVVSEFSFEKSLVLLSSTLNELDRIALPARITTILTSDINNDKYIEIITGASSSDNELRVYRVSGSTLAEIWSKDFNGDIYPHGIDLADINNDGYLDIVVGSEDGSVKVFSGVSGGLLWTVPALGSVNSVVAGDINNDNLIEIVVGRYDGDVLVYSSTGNLLYSKNVGSGFVNDLEIIDLNNDMQKEIVYGDSDGNLAVLNSNLAIINRIATGNAAITTIKIADVNNDNNKEIVVGTDWTINDNDLHVYSFDLIQLWTYNLTGVNGIWNHGIDLADINNDWVSDVIAVDSGNDTLLVTKLEGCKISFSDQNEWKSMFYNTVNGKYYYNRTFGEQGNYEYFVECSEAGFEQQEDSGVFAVFQNIPVEICNNGIDDDYDGYIDCADGDCTQGAKSKNGFCCGTGCSTNGGNCVDASIASFTCTDGNCNTYSEACRNGELESSLVCLGTSLSCSGGSCEYNFGAPQYCDEILPGTNACENSPGSYDELACEVSGNDCYYEAEENCDAPDGCDEKDENECSAYLGFQCEWHNTYDDNVVEECDSGCGAISQCDEEYPGYDYTSCTTAGQTYFADQCSSFCFWEDRGDNVCRSSAFASGCTAASNCNSKSPGTDLNTCNQAGQTYYEDECSSSCQYADIISVFECTETGCSCPQPLCDGLTTGSNIITCSSGQTYFADKCTSAAGGEDRGDNICRSSAFAVGCTADTRCNGVTAGTGNCNSTCGYKTPRKPDGEQCLSNDECLSNYCDNDGVGLSDDNWCFTPFNTYFDGQENIYCEYTTNNGIADCDERQVGDDLNKCVGTSYYEDECSNSCGYQDITSVFECSDSGCLCTTAECDGIPSQGVINYCNKGGQTYFQDDCSSNAVAEDTNNICRSANSLQTGDGCTASVFCNGKTPDSKNTNTDECCYGSCISLDCDNNDDIDGSDGTLKESEVTSSLCTNSCSSYSTCCDQQSITCSANYECEFSHSLISNEDETPNNVCYKPNSGDWRFASSVESTETACNDGYDNDCDGLIDLADSNCIGCVDNDGDGYSAIAPNCPSGNDCNDNNPTINPVAAEVCNGVDDNCNAQIDEGGNLLCNDNLYCNGIETCVGLNGCQAGIPIDCSSNSINIAECFYNPDNIDYTYDYYSFTSQCDEINNKCTEAPSNWQNQITHSCNISQCSAECENNNNCPNKCIGETYYYSGNCQSCECQYETENCNQYDGWKDITNKRWVEAGECTEKEQKEQEYRDYTCGASGCGYTVTNNRWVDTGLTRNKPDNAQCDDGLFCTVNDQCTSGVCIGSNRDCSANGLPAIGQCSYIPDNNPFTWDYFAGFISQCNENLDKCTTGIVSLTHECNVELCNADCDDENQCRPNTCSITYNDYCDNKKVVEYDNDKIKDSTTVQDSCSNTCQNDCVCTDCTTDCSPPSTNSHCVKDVCGAECKENNDCDDSDINTVDICLSECTCTHSLTCIDNDNDGYSVNGGSCGAIDCNDNNANINPGATEVCDGIDNNCNTQIDEGNACLFIYYCDEDNDNYLSQKISGICKSYGCIPNGCKEKPGKDCDDYNPQIHPKAKEIQDGIDNNCDGFITKSITKGKITKDSLNIEGLWFGDYGFVYKEEQIPIYISIRNKGKRDLKNVKIAVVFPDLGIIETTEIPSIKIGDIANKDLQIKLPNNIKSGIYTARISFTVANVEKVYYKEFIIV